MAEVITLERSIGEIHVTLDINKPGTFLIYLTEPVEYTFVP